jgi:hypothetical protein
MTRWAHELHGRGLLVGDRARFVRVGSLGCGDKEKEMSLERLTLRFAGVLVALGLAGSAGAQQTYLLNAASGGQFQIGGGLPLPIQLTDATPNGIVDWGASGPAGGTAPTVGPGAGVFPPLLIPRKQGATVMGQTGMTMGQTLTVPAGVLSHPAAQNTLGVNAQNAGLYAVATNLGFKWPAAAATFMQRTMTPTGGAGTITFFATNTMTVYKASLGSPATRKIRYKNTGVAAPFGGNAPGNITPMFGSGLKPTVAVTVYALAGAKVPPPCTGCLAAIIAARPSGPGAIGGKALTTVTTMGTGVAGKNVYAIKAGAFPKGTIIGTPAPVATGAVPTNMAMSDGFFWTTGMIDVSAMALGAPEHFFLSGTDLRTAMGQGTIQMVSGSLSTRPASGPNANRGWVRLVLVSPGTVPSISNMGLAALSVVLLGIAFVAQQRLRRRAAGIA